MIEETIEAELAERLEERDSGRSELTEEGRMESKWAILATYTEWAEKDGDTTVDWKGSRRKF